VEAIDRRPDGDPVDRGADPEAGLGEDLAGRDAPVAADLESDNGGRLRGRFLSGNGGRGGGEPEEDERE
jgi:hypothetical protein